MLLVVCSDYAIGCNNNKKKGNIMSTKRDKIIILISIMTIIMSIIYGINKVKIHKDNQELTTEAHHTNKNILLLETIETTELTTEKITSECILSNTKANKGVKVVPTTQEVKEITTEYITQVTTEYIEAYPTTISDEAVSEVITEEEIKEDTTEDTTETASSEDDGMTYIGGFELTMYCPTGNPCADGVYPSAGYTVACNDSRLWHKWIYIEGMGRYFVHDTGGMSSNVIDIFTESYDEAINFGRGYANVYIIN